MTKIYSYLLVGAAVGLVAVLALGVAAVAAALLTSLLWAPPLAAYYLHQAFLERGWWSHPLLLWLAVVVVMLALERVVLHRPAR